MWDWGGEAFQTGLVADEPTLVSFVSGLVVEGAGGLDVNQSILSRYRMRALPLIEWDLSPDAPSLFGVLRSAGATRGYFIDYPGESQDLGRFRKCDLSLETALVVSQEALLGCATIFVDNLFLSAIAAWFSDFTYLCMSPRLFEIYLSANPMFLDLYGNELELPAGTFEAALQGAFARLDQWSSSREALRSALEWQLVRPSSGDGG